jgi:hypothetical protein
MTSPLFKKAERKQAKLRLGISGPAGSGKTFSALQIAFGIGGRIAVIDTEHSSAELYAHLGDYDVAVLEPPFTINKYLDTIHGAEAAGYSTIIIDSLSHAWAGEGGLLDQQGALAKRGVNSYTAWRDITPMHTQLIEAMLQSPAHIIATMRSKTDYVLQENGKGKMAPIKVGMAPVQREGMDYEFTVVFDMGLDHTASVSKDRTSLFSGQYFKPDRDTGGILNAWLTSGAAAPAPAVPREIPDTSRPAASAINEAPIRLNPPTPAPRDADAGPVLRCDVCGRSNADYPDLPIRERDGQMICGPCWRKAEKDLHVPSPAEPAPAPVKAVPKPPAKVAAPVASGAVCEDCGKVLEPSEEKTSKLFCGRPICRACLEHANGPQPGEPGRA